MHAKPCVLSFRHRSMDIRGGAGSAACSPLPLFPRILSPRYNTKDSPRRERRGDESSGNQRRPNIDGSLVGGRARRSSPLCHARTGSPSRRTHLWRKRVPGLTRSRWRDHPRLRLRKGAALMRAPRCLWVPWRFSDGVLASRQR